MIPDHNQPLSKLLPIQHPNNFGIEKFEPVCSYCKHKTNWHTAVGVAEIQPDFIEIETWSICEGCQDAVHTHSRLHADGNFVHRNEEGWEKKKPDKRWDKIKKPLQNIWKKIDFRKPRPASCQTPASEQKQGHTT